MKIRGIVAGAGLLLMALLTPASAADATPRCVGIFEDAPRLACYDAQFGKPVHPEAVRNQILPAPAAKTSPNPPVQKMPEPAKTAAGVVSHRITEVGRISNERFVVTLDDGQVWTQLERDPNVQVQVGDTVTIRPGILGSRMLETRGGVRTRVRTAR